MQQNAHRKGLALAHIAVLFFGFSGVLAKAIPQSSIVLTGVRSGLAAIALFLYLSLIAGLQRPDKRQSIFLLVTGGLLALHWIAFYESIKVSTVAIGAVAVTTFPVMTALIEPLVSNVRFTWQSLTAALMVSTGAAIMLGFEPEESALLGMLYGFLAAFIYTIIHLVNKSHVTDLGGTQLSMYQLAVAGLVMLPWTISGMDMDSPTLVEDLALMAVLGIVCTAAAYSLFIESMRFIPAQTSAVLTGLEPVYASLIAWALLQEKIDLKTAIGGGIILVAVLWGSYAAPANELD